MFLEDPIADTSNTGIQILIPSVRAQEGVISSVAILQINTYSRPTGRTRRQMSSHGAGSAATGGSVRQQTRLSKHPLAEEPCPPLGEVSRLGGLCVASRKQLHRLKPPGWERLQAIQLR